jgi:hypothetical protein
MRYNLESYTTSRFRVLVQTGSENQGSTDKVEGDAATAARRNPIPVSNFLGLAKPPTLAMMHANFSMDTYIIKDEAGSMHALRSEELHLLSVLGVGADKIGDDATGGREEKNDLGRR